MLHQALRNAGVSLEMRVQGKVVALLGENGMSGLIVRLFHYGLFQQSYEQPDQTAVS